MTSKGAVAKVKALLFISLLICFTSAIHYMKKKYKIETNDPIEATKAIIGNYFKLTKFNETNSKNFYDRYILPIRLSTIRRAYESRSEEHTSELQSRGLI